MKLRLTFYRPSLMEVEVSSVEEASQILKDLKDYKDVPGIELVNDFEDDDALWHNPMGAHVINDNGEEIHSYAKEVADAEDAYPDGWTCGVCGESYHQEMPAKIGSSTICSKCV